MGKQVAVERGVLVEQLIQFELALGGDQLVEPDGARWHVRPVARGQTVVRVRASLPHRLEDHVPSLRIRHSPVPTLASCPDAPVRTKLDVNRKELRPWASRTANSK